MIENGIIEFNKFKVIETYMENDPPLVYVELFRFITDALYIEEREIDDATFMEMIPWHDALYQTINNMMLYAG